MAAVPIRCRLRSIEQVQADSFMVEGVFVPFKRSLKGFSGALRKGVLVVGPPVATGSQITLQPPPPKHDSSPFEEWESTVTWFTVAQPLPNGKLSLVGGKIVALSDVSALRGFPLSSLLPGHEVLFQTRRGQFERSRWILLPNLPAEAHLRTNDQELWITADRSKSSKRRGPKTLVGCALFANEPVYDIDDIAITLRTFGDRFNGSVIIYDDRLDPPRVRRLYGDENWALTGFDPADAQWLQDIGAADIDLTRLAANAITASTAAVAAETLATRAQQHKMLLTLQERGLPWLSPEAPVKKTGHTGRVLLSLLAEVRTQPPTPGQEIGPRRWEMLASADGTLLIGEDVANEGRLHKPGKAKATAWATQLLGYPPAEVFLINHPEVRTLDGEVVNWHFFGALIDKERGPVITGPSPAMKWFHLRELENTVLDLPARAALGLIRSWLDPVSLAASERASISDAAFWLQDTLGGFGVVPPKKVQPKAVPQGVPQVEWDAILDQEDLRQQAVAQAVAASTDEAVAAWADFVKPIDREDLHPAMAAEVITDPLPGLADVLVVNRLICEETAIPPPVTRPPAPPPDFVPTSWQDLLYPWAVSKMLQWQATALKGERATCFIGQDGFLPPARGIVWNLTQGTPFPMDLTTPIVSHLNEGATVEALNKLGYIDRALIQGLRDGVSFQAVEIQELLQIRLATNLHSLENDPVGVPAGYQKLEEEFGWFESFNSLPCLPIQIYPRGTAPKPPGWRPTTDSGFPRPAGTTTNGQRVRSMNDVMADSKQPDNQGYLPHGLLLHPGQLLSEAAVSESLDLGVLRPWPKEHKPRWEDVASFMAATKDLSLELGWPIITAQEDFSKFFNQLKTRPDEHWCTMAHYPVDDCSVYIMEKVLTFGITVASNFASRFSCALNHLFCVRMDEAFALILPDLRRRFPPLDRWVTRREKLSASVRTLHTLYDSYRSVVMQQKGPRPSFRSWLKTHYASLGRLTSAQQEELVFFRSLPLIEKPYFYSPFQARLYIAPIYTDDLKLEVCGEITLLLGLKVLNRIWLETGVMISIPKRLLGLQSVWLGIGCLDNLGIAYLPKRKRARGLLEVGAILDLKAASSEYYATLCFLEHFVFAFGFKRDRMRRLWMIYKNSRDPAEQVSKRWAVEAGLRWPEVAKDLQAWLHQLLHSVGVSLIRQATVTTDLAEGDFVVVSSDAAKDGATIPGLGIYCQGLCSRFELSPAHLRIPIAVLEFVGAIAAAIVVARSFSLRHLGRDTRPPRVLLQVDAVSSPVVLASSRSTKLLMVTAHDFLLATPEYALLAPHLWVCHLSGETNGFADSLSRGELDRFAQMCALLRVKPREVPFPEEVARLLDDLVALLPVEHREH